ncbi:MAG: hypothetical protein EXR75_06875 [Myxococcales bacterium]|nr:hypothetical protein [Myxococcales bacterium]
MCVALLLPCCGSAPASSDAVTSAGGSGGAGPSTKSSSSGPQVPAIFASVLSELEAGEGPAMLDMVNATEALYVTVQVGRANFIQIAPGVKTSAQLGTSANVLMDMRLGFHATDDGIGACVFVKPKEVNGPNAFAPGHGYTITVSGPADSFIVDVTEVAELEPFIALRGWNWAAIPGMTKLVVKLADTVEPVEFPFLTEVPTEYALLVEGAAPVAAIEQITFVEHDGDLLSAEFPLALTGAAGFTAVLSYQALDGALSSHELE